MGTFHRQERRRPTVVLVTWKIAPPGHPAGDLAKIIPLASEHVDFTVISSELADEVRPLVRWHRTPSLRSWGRLTWALFFVGASIRLRGVRPDLVHTLGPAPLVAGRVDLASIIFCHALYHAALDGRPGRGRRGLWRLARGFTVVLERWSYRPDRVRVLGAECTSAKRTLERHFPSVDVAVVPTYPIDTVRFRPDAAAREEVRRAEAVRPHETVALFVGRDWELKGLSVAIQGLAEARLGSSGRLWVLGTGNVPKYEAVAAEAGVGNRVRFLGNRADVERYYQAADVFVLPTLCETFCRAGYEAAACGLPVIATPVDGITELVGDSESGLLVERNAASVGRALARLAADPELCSRLGEEGRRRSLECTVERSAGALVATYERLVAETER